MEKVSIQIQSVLYHNEKDALEKAIMGLAKAITVNKERDGSVNQCLLKYGDASKEPIYTQEEINIMNQKLSGILSIEYRYFDCNTGTAKGHNRLGEKCSMDYMMIMNPDVIVSPHFFIEMMKPFENNLVGLVEARQTPIEHPKEYNMKTFETAWSTTACVIFPTKIFKEVHGFDAQSFFMYCDDVDFSWRIRLLGYKLFYQPLAPVFHAKQLSSDGNWQPTAAERYYSAEAALMMAHKWSNNKLLTRLLWDFKRSKNDELKKAADEFAARRKAGKLVRPVDEEHKVATFVEGGYAKHRFIM
ncbi:glycosyltransferase family 2 protein [Lachnospiraceae bacterium LCP25S3_G4]